MTPERPIVVIALAGVLFVGSLSAVFTAPQQAAGASPTAAPQ
jgi:hypothetical protein